MVSSKTLVNTILYLYDSEGTLTRKRILPADGAAQDIWYQKADDNTVAKFTAAGTISRKFSYHDGEVTQEHKDNIKVKSDATTQLVSKIEFFDGRTLCYEYDAEERITKVTDSVDGITEYTYDALGQLLTETVNGTVVNTMTYDNYGNIVSKNGTAYTYGDGVWKDLLTAYDGQAITYDAQGNPISYLGNTLTWEKGRQLKSFGSNSYKYNNEGIRPLMQSLRH